MLGDIKSDERGDLMEFANQGGQTFIVKIKPHQTRGGHYHTHKVERFLVVEGSVLVRERGLNETCAWSKVFSGRNWQPFSMPAFTAHSFTNCEDTDATMVVWASEVFDPGNPDTYQEKV